MLKKSKLFHNDVRNCIRCNFGETGNKILNPAWCTKMKKTRSFHIISFFHGIIIFSNKNVFSSINKIFLCPNTQNEIKFYNLGPQIFLSIKHTSINFVKFTKKKCDFTKFSEVYLRPTPTFFWKSLNFTKFSEPYAFLTLLTMYTA